jgi:hypothetical protein
MIYMVKVFETFITHYFYSLKIDPKIKSQKIKIKSIYTICSRSGSYGVFFFIHSKGILGINLELSHVALSHVLPLSHVLSLSHVLHYFPNLP